MSIKSFIATTGFLIISGLCLTAQNQWEALNPKPSENTGVKIYFTSPDTGFIINNKQILKTTDCGQKWSISKEITSSNDITFLKSSGYIVGNNGYVLKTTNKGLSWSTINVGITDNLNSVFVISRDTVIITGTNTFIKSVDGGNTWQSTDIPNYSINKAFFINSKTGHAACNSGIILKTRNGGQSWYATESVTYSPSDVMAISFVNKNTGFASREHNDILKTIDGGEHWVKIANTSDAIYAFNFQDEQNGFIAGIYGVIFKTNNGGSTWNWAGFQDGRIDGTDINSLCFLNSNLGFAVGQRGMILKTTDGGTTWKKYAPTYTSILQLDFLTANTAYALAGNEFLKTTDAGNTWQITGAPLPNCRTPKFSFVNENIGYCIAGGDLSTSTTSGFVYKTINGGVTWTKTNYGTGVHSDNLLSIYFVNENTGYLSGGTNQNSVYKTIDGGNTWELISNLSFVQMQFLNEQVGYGRTYNNLYRTIDGGKNWVSSYTHDNEITSFHFIDEKNGYWIGDISMLYNTHDGGVTWNKVTIPYGYYVYVKFYSANIGYILDDYGKLFKTTNGGASWDNIYNKNGVNSIGFFGDNIFLSGSSGMILKSKIEIPPVYFQLNPSSGISNNNVTFTGNIASNEGKVENIRFEYGISSFDKVIIGVPSFVNAGSASNITASINGLLPNTSYNYRLKATYNGQDYISDALQFKTFPDYELRIDYITSSSNDAAVIARVVSNKGPVTYIEFQYGTDTTFTSNISAVPCSAEEGITTFVNGNLTSLKADTKYYVRIKATINGTTRYSPITYFNTKKEYIISFNTPVISGTSVTFTAAVIANKDAISNIVLEYGTTINYGRKVNTNPAAVGKSLTTYINGQVLNLNPDSVYFYRIKGLMGSSVIYSEDNVISLKGSIIMKPLKEEQKTNNSVLVKGLINSSGKFLNNIRFQYGLSSGSFTDSVNASTSVVCSYVTSTVDAIMNNLEPGKQYHFRISASEGTKRYYSEEIVFDQGHLTGIELNNSDPDVLVYPNPTKGFINIKSPYSLKGCRLFDLSGKALLIKKEATFIDISEYPKGLYILKISFNNKVVIRRIIKN